VVSARSSGTVASSVSTTRSTWRTWRATRWNLRGRVLWQVHTVPDGSTRGVEVIDRIMFGVNREQDLTLLEELCDTMLNGSLCGSGHDAVPGAKAP